MITTYYNKFQNLEYGKHTLHTTSLYLCLKFILDSSSLETIVKLLSRDPNVPASSYWNNLMMHRSTNTTWLESHRKAHLQEPHSPGNLLIFAKLHFIVDNVCILCEIHYIYISTYMFFISFVIILERLLLVDFTSFLRLHVFKILV